MADMETHVGNIDVDGMARAHQTARTVDSFRYPIERATEAILKIVRAFESDELTPTALLQLIPVLKAFETARRGLAIVDLEIADVVVDGELSRLIGTTHPDDYLGREFRLRRRDARTRVGAVRFLTDHPVLAGSARGALRSGDMTLAGIVEISKELESLDDRAERSGSDIAAEVIARAPAHGPHGTGALCRKLVKEENRRFPRDPNAAHRARRLSVGAQDDDGGARINGYLDASTIALLEAWLLSHGVKKATHDDGRSPSQRNADALDLALRTAHEAHPRVKGKPMCTVIAALDADDLRVAIGDEGGGDPHLRTHPTRLTVTAGTGTDLGLVDLLRLGLSNDMYAAIIDPQAPVTESRLRLGRTKRSATLDQRIALQLIDGTCRHPGCTRPADACDAHHLVAWLLGGATDLDNLTLLCRRHHSDNDDTRADPRRGHMTPRSDDAAGRTGWAHPARSDGTRTVEFNGVAA